MNRKEFDEIVLKKTKEKGLIMSRVPEKTRLEFIKFAEEEFADDRGMLLKKLMDDYKEYAKLKEMFFNNRINIKIVVENQMRDKDGTD